jgi:hypothetical protein
MSRHWLLVPEEGIPQEDGPTYIGEPYVLVTDIKYKYMRKRIHIAVDDEVKRGDTIQLSDNVVAIVTRVYTISAWRRDREFAEYYIQVRRIYPTNIRRRHDRSRWPIGRIFIDGNDIVEIKPFMDRINGYTYNHPQCVYRDKCRYNQIIHRSDGDVTVMDSYFPCMYNRRTTDDVTPVKIGSL